MHSMPLSNNVVFFTSHDELARLFPFGASYPFVFVVFKKTMFILSKSGQVKNVFYFNYFFEGKNITRFLHSIYIRDLRLFWGGF